MTEPAKPPPVVRESTVDLQTSARITCAILGVASEVFAAIVLWRGEGGAATVAFVVFGAVLVILAASGVLPRRIKSGAHEVEMFRQQVIEETQQTTDNALATMTRREMEEFIEESLRSRDESGSAIPYVAATRTQQALDSENSTLDSLARLARDALVETEVVDDYGRWDARITFPNGHRVNVDFIWQLSLTSLNKLLEEVDRNRAAYYWVIYSRATDDTRLRISEVLEQAATQQIPLRLVISDANQPTIAGVVKWLGYGGARPKNPFVMASF